MQQQEIPRQPLTQHLLIQSPGSTIRTEHACMGVRIIICGKIFLANLIIIDTQGLDVILGSDWLCANKGILNFENHSVNLTHPDGTQVQFQMLPASTSKQQTLNSVTETTIDQVPVVCEYPDVFPDELPGMPSDRDMEFVIELLPGTTPISKRPYRMPPNELAELKEQLQDQLSKGYIRPSTSPWGAPILFVP